MFGLWLSADEDPIPDGLLYAEDMIDSTSLHVISSTDPATNVVYAHEASDVVLTVVDGRVLYRGGEFTPIDIPQRTHDVKLQREHLETRAGLRT